MAQCGHSTTSLGGSVCPTPKQSKPPRETRSCRQWQMRGLLRTRPASAVDTGGHSRGGKRYAWELTTALAQFPAGTCAPCSGAAHLGYWQRVATRCETQLSRVYELQSLACRVLCLRTLLFEGAQAHSICFDCTGEQLGSTQPISTGLRQANRVHHSVLTRSSDDTLCSTTGAPLWTRDGLACALYYY